MANTRIQTPAHMMRETMMGNMMGDNGMHDDDETA
jgi:hypothetical protein